MSSVIIATFVKRAIKNKSKLHLTTITVSCQKVLKNAFRESSFDFIPKRIEMSNNKKTIAVVEMSYIIRKGLVYSLSQLPIVDKVVEWKDIENLGLQSVSLKPDAIVINPMLLGRMSKAEIRQKFKLDKKIVIIALVYNMIDDLFYQSYDAVIRINDSESNIESIVTNALNQNNKDEANQDDLSERETEILKSLVKGMSNKEIAEYHNISIHTVITHRRNIARKLEIHSVSGLTIYAIINKLVDVNDIKY